MRITTIPVVVAILFGAGLSVAPLAHADVPMTEGVYNYVESDGVAGTWTVTTSCTPQCVANVTTTPGYGFTAPLVNGRYSVTRDVPDGVTCPSYTLGNNASRWPGGTYSVTVKQWWDSHTLVGGVNFLDSPSPCGIPNPYDTFTLRKIG